MKPKAFKFLHRIHFALLLSHYHINQFDHLNCYMFIPKYNLLLVFRGE